MSAIQQYQEQKVQLKKSNNVRVMTVTSTHELATNIRGTVKFSGKTIVVQYNEVSLVWHQI